MTLSQVFLGSCLFFVAGILFVSFLGLAMSFWLGFLMTFLVLCLFRPKNPVLVSLLFFSLFMLGMGRFHLSLLRYERSLLHSLAAKNEEALITGRIDKVSETRSGYADLIIKPDNFHERILLTTWRYPEFKYGDEVQIKGIVKEPENFGSFDYRSYLVKEGIYGLMYFPKITKTGRRAVNPVFSFIFHCKGVLKDSINRILPVPHSGLLAALIFGDEEDIPEEWKDRFNITGTRHIAAVSGMNITILSSLVLSFLLILGFWRRQAFYLSVCFIILYVLMIGAPASGVRAAVMGIFFLVAQHVGRLSQGVRSVIFAAAFMLLLNPLILRFDLGFQLSFLAVLGLIYLYPVFSHLFKNIPGIFQIKYTLSATLAAQAFVLPLLVYHFEDISLISPLANILIVPVLPILTILGIVLAVSNISFPFIGYVFFLPVWFLLAYILRIIEVFSNMPYAVVKVSSFPLWAAAIFYMSLVFFIWQWQKKQALKVLGG